MQQEKIWDYFQNEGRGERKSTIARQRFIVYYLKPKHAVLNIGLGDGGLEQLGMAKGVKMHTLDPNAKAIERLRQTLGMGERAQTGYAQKIPFQNGNFDTVVMCEVLEHMEDQSLVEALREVLRVLKPGGFLMASTPYKENIRFHRVVCPNCGDIFHKVGHMQSFDQAKMRNILKGQGFKVDKLWVSTFVDWQRKGLKNLLKSLLRVLLARMGENIAGPHLIVIASKPREGQG